MHKPQRLSVFVGAIIFALLAFARAAAADGSSDAVHVSKEELDRAIAVYSETLRLDPRNAIVYLARGLLYSEKGDHDRAKADFSEAVRIDPRLAADVSLGVKK